MRIGFLGTGLMGAPMARNLALAGFPVTAWNRTAATARPLADDGIRLAATAAEAADGADVVIVMTSDAASVEAVLFDTAGAAEALATGVLVLVMSSIPVDAARTLAGRLAERGAAFVDAPVSGGERGAIAGTLSIMAGGAAEDIARLAPVFAPLGRMTHVGPVGAGQLAKLANQMIVGVTIAAVAEALLLVERGGGDPAATRRALLGGFADSTVLREHGERMLAANFKPGAHATTQLKDLKTAVAQAQSTRAPVPVASLAASLFEAMCGTTLADADHSALYLWLRDTPPGD